MPNVLLFGCDRRLVETLSQDSRWNVFVGVHAKETDPNAPDPTFWHLVVDDCGNENEPTMEGVLQAEGKGPVRASWDYFDEMTRAHGIHLAGAGWHMNSRGDPPKGYRALEFNPASERAVHLSDFVDVFAPTFQRACVTHYRGDDWSETLFQDVYGAPVIDLSKFEGVVWLTTVNIPEKEARLSALQHLCYRTAPKLWPDLYSDQFQPRKVQELIAGKNKLVEERRREEKAIDEEIDAEQALYAPYFNLAMIGDDALKDLVLRVFQDVFGCQGSDLDAELGEGEEKTLDLLLKCDSWEAFLEVRSSGNRNARVEDLGNLDDNYEEAKRRHGEAQFKLLVFNGMYRRDAEERNRRATFSGGVDREAKIRGIGLLSTEQLLHAIEAYRSEEVSKTDILAALSQQGVIRIRPAS